MGIFNLKRIEHYIKKLLLSKHYLLKRRSEMFLRSEYELEITLLDQLTNKNSAAIDVGVYRGVYSFQLLKHSKHVYAFEANPLIFNELKQAFKPEEKITIENLALSSKSEADILRIPFKDKNIYSNNLEEKFELGLASIHNKNKLDNKDFLQIEVEKKKLDDCDISHLISFIKIDVEGHELEVIRGGVKLINKYKPNLLIEIEKRHTGYEPIKTINEVKSLGYNCYYLDKNTRLLVEVNELNIKNLNVNNFIFKSDSQT